MESNFSTSIHEEIREQRDDLLQTCQRFWSGKTVKIKVSSLVPTLRLACHLI